MNSWQSIETYPNDESAVLMYGVIEGEINGLSNDGPEIVVASGRNDDYYTVDATDVYGVQVHATHWMPLPIAPTTTPGE